MIKKIVEQGSPEWLQMRLEKIGGTRLGSAIGSPARQETLVNELIAERITGEPLPHFVSGAMERGTEAERFAIAEYEERTGNRIDTVGMCVHDNFNWLYMSPDGLVGENGAVEIKCPNTVKAVKYQRDDVIPKEYYEQCLSYFLVNEKLLWLDFVVYDPRIKEEKMQIWIKRMRRDEAEITLTLEKVRTFYDYYNAELDKLGLGF